MSDDRLRQLERRFKETGLLEDEAAWLRERLRVGQIDQASLELAAYCGHQGAAAACGPSAPRPLDLESAARQQRLRDEVKRAELKAIYGAHKHKVWSNSKGEGDPEEFRAWMERLGTWGIEARVPAAWELVYEAFEGLRREPGLEEPLYALAEWILDPSENNVSLAALAAKSAEELATQAYENRMFVSDCGSATSFPVDQEPMMVWCLTEVPSKPGYANDVAVEAAEHLSGNCEAWAIVQRGLIPWALRQADPIRMRVAKRREVEILSEDLSD